MYVCLSYPYLCLWIFSVKMDGKTIRCISQWVSTYIHMYLYLYPTYRNMFIEIHTHIHAYKLSCCIVVCRPTAKHPVQWGNFFRRIEKPTNPVHVLFPKAASLCMYVCVFVNKKKMIIYASTISMSVRIYVCIDMCVIIPKNQRKCVLFLLTRLAWVYGSQHSPLVIIYVPLSVGHNRYRPHISAMFAPFILLLQ